jgi:hypothetical protein
MLTIVTELRGSQWTAYPESLPDIRVTGRTQAEAVGRLIVAKTRRLPVQIKRIETDTSLTDKEVDYAETDRKVRRSKRKDDPRA